MPYPCQFEGCSVQCATPSALKSHTLTHTGEKPFACGVENCNSSFARKSSLDVHMRTHASVRQATCPQCHEELSCEQAVANHLRSVHGIGNQPLISCSFQGCSYKHWRQSKVTQHEAIHSTEKSHKCPYDACEKVYRRLHHLKEHINAAHTRERVHTCDRCDYNTPWKQLMDEHLRDGHDPETGEVVRNWRETRSLSLLSEMLSCDVEKAVRIDCDNATRPYIRVDGVVKTREVMFVFEIDEGQHKDMSKYTVADEIMRMRAASQVILRTNNNVCWVRMNPDLFSLDDTYPVVTLKTRVETATHFIQSYVPVQELAVVYLFYDERNGRPTVLDDPEYDAWFKEHVVLNHQTAATASEVAPASSCVSPAVFFETNEHDGDSDSDSSKETKDGDDDVRQTAAASFSSVVHRRQTSNTTCEACGKTFFDRSTYLKHIKHVHEKQQRATGSFACPHCGKVYTQSHTLKTHIDSVHGGKVWTCDVCGSTSKSKSNLATHKKVQHGGDKTPVIQCAFCTFTTKFTQSMAQHVRRHHAGGGASA